MDLVAFRHALSDPHADAEEVCLDLAGDVRSEFLPVLVLVLPRVLVSRSGNRI